MFLGDLYLDTLTVWKDSVSFCAQNLRQIMSDEKSGLGGRPTP